MSFEEKNSKLKLSGEEKVKIKPDLDVEHYTQVFKGEEAENQMLPKEKEALEKRKYKAWRILGLMGLVVVTIRMTFYKFEIITRTTTSEVVFIILYFISFYIVLKLVERAYDL